VHAKGRKLQANLFEFLTYHNANAIESAAHRTQLRETNMELELGKSEVIFTLFHKLLPELRIKIWGHACSVTRDIDIPASPPRFSEK